MENVEFSNENVINLVQNEPVLWDSSMNSTEEEKEIVWKYFPPAHSSGNNVLNVPNLSLLRMYALTHVLCFRFLFLTSDIAMAAPRLANINEVHATTSTSSSAILT